MNDEETLNEEIKKKLDRIETALYGTGNPRGGLFQQVSTMSAKIEGVFVGDLHLTLR